MFSTHHPTGAGRRREDGQKATSALSPPPKHILGTYAGEDKGAGRCKLLESKKMVSRGLSLGLRGAGLDDALRLRESHQLHVLAEVLLDELLLDDGGVFALGG